MGYTLLLKMRIDKFVSSTVAKKLDFEFLSFLYPILLIFGMELNVKNQ